jgi:hypothetical protein
MPIEGEEERAVVNEPLLINPFLNAKGYDLKFFSIGIN